MAIPSQAIKPVIPEVFSSHRHTVWLPKHGGQEAQTGNHRRRIQRITRHATTRQFSENARRFTVTRQGVRSIRVDAYIPELPADSTAVRITAFITAAAESRPACWNTRVNGLTLMSLTSLRSRLRIGVRNNQADNQDREHIEQQDSPGIPDVPLAWNVFAGSSDSPAAIPISSVPLEREADNHSYADHRRKTTSKRRSPIVQLLQPAGCAPLKIPIIISTPTMIKTITVVTLISENQYSASPKPRTEMWFNRKITPRNNALQIQPGVSRNHQHDQLCCNQVNG